MAAMDAAASVTESAATADAPYWLLARTLTV